VSPLTIVDPADPRIAPYRDVREGELVKRRGRFIAEGEVVLEKAVRFGRHPLESVLLAEGRVAGLAPVLARLAPEVPVYAAPQAVLDAIAGFPIHRGVLALGRRAPDLQPAALLAGVEAPAVVLGLVGIANHDNMGGLFRNAAAFGAAAVLIDATSCDPLYRKAIRTSVGASLIVPFARLSPDQDMVEAVRAAGFEPLALSPEGGEPLAGLAPPARAAVILGAEGPGLPAELAARARAVSIPMAGGFDSLNVATTAGIVLHHLTQAAGR
jgi:tRNA G18 (ribose-2'-O)-methylase SpoU